MSHEHIIFKRTSKSLCVYQYRTCSLLTFCHAKQMEILYSIDKSKTQCLDCRQNFSECILINV